MAVARLYGEPLFTLPQDLYIPPDALEVFLEAFEGPLDLLLYLIRRQNFNILDIPLADVTKQYLEYVDQIRSRNLELAAEYLLMAAMLIEIKSRMLLPARKSEDGKEAEDPRAELVRRLLEYEQIKLAAAKLDALPLLGRDFLRVQVTAVEHSAEPRLPEVHADDLRQAWADILRRATLKAHHHITREQLSVREHMSIVLRRLQGRRFVEFHDLFDVTRAVAGDRGHLHRAARAGARKPARSDAGRGVRADLRAAGVPAELNGEWSNGSSERARPGRRCVDRWRALAGDTFVRPCRGRSSGNEVRSAGPARQWMKRCWLVNIARSTKVEPRCSPGAYCNG